MVGKFSSFFSLLASRFTRYAPLSVLSVCLALLTFGALCAAAQDRPVVQNIRHLSTADSTRVIVTLSTAIPYQVVTEPADAEGTSPSRIQLDFSPAHLSVQTPTTLRVENGLLKGIHTGQISAKTVRLTLEVERVGSYRTIALRYPDQVVIHLMRETAQRQLSSPPANASLADPSQQLSSLPTTSLTDTSRSSPYRIMIDPGHGGYDPGAQGIDGLEEKTVVLAISKRLGRKLTGRLPVEVLFTRIRDVFLPLEERTARANTAEANLFISIHANASPNLAMQGIETYYLNNTNDRAAIRLATLENQFRQKLHLQQREAELSFILSDLIQTGKEEESIALAHALQQSLVRRASERYPQVHNLGVKKGPFYVLVGAHMPCVLVEIAFLTHPLEGKRLGSSAYQEALAEGLFQGIARFLRTGMTANNL